MLVELLVPDVRSCLRRQTKDEEPRARLVTQSSVTQRLNHRRLVDPKLEGYRWIANREIHRFLQQSNDLRGISQLTVYHRTSNGACRQRFEVQQTSGRLPIEEGTHSDEGSSAIT